MKRDQITDSESQSQAPSFETLEGYLREQVQGLVQKLLEEEVTDYLGRERYERSEGSDEATPAYRNGHGKPRRLTLSNGTIEVRRPRLRNLSEHFESQVLPLFKRHSKTVSALLPELYLHGLALRDFDLALRGLLGDDAPLSPSSIARLKADWLKEYDSWQSEPIEEEPVYMWADGIYVKAGLEKAKAAILVVIGAFQDGTKRVLAAQPGYRESCDSWKEVFRALEKRGIKTGPKILVADGGLGLWAAVAELGWTCREQRCWKHKITNVSDVLPYNEQKPAQKILRSIPQSKTREEAEARRDAFIESYGQRYPKAAERLQSDWNRMVAFYDFPRGHWKHLRTSNIVESPFQVVRLRTGAAKRFKRVDNAMAVIWKLLMVAESTFRQLAKIHLLEDVARGQEYINGTPVNEARNSEAA